MKLEKVAVKNFRTLVDVEVSFDGYFASISGKNNAGKTALIKVIRYLFREQEEGHFIFVPREEIIYSKSKTLWIKGDDPIVFEYWLSLSKEYDPGLINFIEKIAEEIEISQEEIVLKCRVSFTSNGEVINEVYVDGTQLSEYSTVEIFQRLHSTRGVFFHNSTTGEGKYFSPYGNSTQNLMFSKDEREQLKKEQEKIKKTVRKFAQNHRGELSGLLGKLDEKYDVELNVFDRNFDNNVPLRINLKDKDLEVPLDDWGSGTQNKTHIMMSIFASSKTKNQFDDLNRVTPILIIEEPESFLHPSAQAEFGNVIRDLAQELEIQTLVTTHSPYMLCQENPASNILMERKVSYKKLRETEIVCTSDDKWMEP